MQFPTLKTETKSVTGPNLSITTSIIRGNSQNLIGFIHGASISAHKKTSPLEKAGID